MKISSESHLDHNLSEAIIGHIAGLFRDRNAFFIETVVLPPELGLVPCNLHGPIVGEIPIPETMVVYQVRGKRDWMSRLCDRPPVMVNTVTVIAGTDGDDPCVLYTAYGGPLAPRELGDPGLPVAERTEATTFWSEHALGKE